MQLARGLVGVCTYQVRPNNDHLLFFKVQNLLGNLIILFIQLKHNLSLRYFFPSFDVNKKYLIEAADQNAIEFMQDFHILDLIR